MARFDEVKLEIIRPGPPHNQLLSRLTRYLALCGEGSPITFTIDLEHYNLLNRLERLRYTSRQRSDMAAVPDRLRASAVSELGEEVAEIFSKIPTVLSEVSRAHGGAASQTDRTRLVHLRLVLGGSELALIPFEMAFAPPAYPGEGRELGLQLDVPVVHTREIRRGRTAAAQWDQPVEPRILCISAEPAGLDVPIQAHVHALLAAMRPWIRWPAGAPQGPAHLEAIKERLRVLPNASIEAIYEECSQNQFTHIHILAHGAHQDVAGERRFGIALCERGNPSLEQIVSGEQLAKALQAEGIDGSKRSHPLVVTLATCDAGNQGSVVVPGGSIAHELHAAGLPWVFASQFPLTKPGSVRLTEALYPRLLRGDDPRQALYEVRRQLYMSGERDHDWASLIAYAAVSYDFEDQVSDFFERQTIRAVQLSLDRIDDADSGQQGQAMPETAADIRSVLDRFEQWQSRLPQGTNSRDRARRAEYFGMRGSTFKRIGLMYKIQNNAPDSKTALMQSLNSYRQAMDEWALDTDKYHWTATQALSLMAVLDQGPNAEVFQLAQMLSERDLQSNERSQQAWAHGTLAELELLRPYHFKQPHNARASAAAKRQVVAHCRKIVDLMGETAFHVGSTRRQFERYVTYWPEWRDMAQAAVDALAPPLAPASAATPPRSDLPAYGT